MNRAPPTSVPGDSSPPRHQRPEASSLGEPGPNGLRLTMSERCSTQHQASSPIRPRTLQTTQAETLRASHKIEQEWVITFRIPAEPTGAAILPGRP